MNTKIIVISLVAFAIMPSQSQACDYQMEQQTDYATATVLSTTSGTGTKTSRL